jgi:branched-chain amino acid transport system substrate-binding protein
MNTFVARTSRGFSSLLAGTATALLALSSSAPVQAAPDPVKLAVILPLSGPYARSGQIELAGIRLAIEEVNAAGGIKSMGNAPLQIELKDAGTSVDSAVSAARELLSQGKKPAGGIGSWLSSYTLGVTEVSERRRVPWITISSSDQVTNRDFQYLYQAVAPSSVWAQTGLTYLDGLGKEKGCPIRNVAIVGDNTAAPTAFFNTVRKGLADKLGWKIVMDETWTPPLADATSLAQKLRATKPDMVLFGASNFSDAAQVLSKSNEYGVRTNYVGNGSWLVMPEYLQSVGADNLEGILVISGAHPNKTSAKLVERFMAASKEPFMQQEGMAGYFNVWILKEAIEKAASDDPEKVNNAMKSLDLTSGIAAESVASRRVKFDEKGRLVGGTPVIAQWQKGVPVSVFPTADAAGAASISCVN